MQKIVEDKSEREQNGELCYNPVDWDKNPWQCPKQPEEIVETTPVPSLIVKSLK